MTIQQAMDMAVEHHRAGRLAEAETIYRQVVAQMPQYAGAWNMLGVLAAQTGHTDPAIELFRQALERQPTLVEAQYNLGLAYQEQWRFDEAVTAFQRAIALQNNHVAAHNNLGICYFHMGRLDDALDAYRSGLRHEPGAMNVWSNLLLAIHYHPAYDRRDIALELGRWNEQQVRPLRGSIRGHGNGREANGRLRIGYVSGDLRDHAVGRTVLPLFTGYDRERFEVIVYSTNTVADAMTDRFRAGAGEWRVIAGGSDEQAAEQIRADGIDILVDLALHTAGNRLGVFARKPSPVQVSFAGYPGSTGLETIDYRLTDVYLEPESELPEALADKPPVAPGGERRDENVCPTAEPPPCPPPGYRGREVVETAVRLPHSFWCYDPLECGDIAVGPLPAERNGYVTFGCLSNFAKINEMMVQLWTRVLRRISDSRLVLLAPEGSPRQRLRDCLEEQGVDPERVEFVARQPRAQYMQAYHGIDIGLDTFPYNGHTTSLDSFWMGVPVVTLVGQTPVARAGWSQLSNLGLTDLAARTPEQFMEIAVGLAKDLPRLAEMRRTLREQMRQSPLMDAVGFAKGVESAYRAMWKQWCRA